MSPNASETTASSALSGLAELNQIFTKILEAAAVVLMTLLVLDVVWGVVTRYVLGEQARWTEELACYLLIWVSLLGGAIAYRRREHLGIDFIVSKFEAPVLHGTKLFTEILSCVVVVVVMIVGGLLLVYDALILEQTTAALGWQKGHVYLMIPFVGILMFLFSLEFILSNLKRDPENASSVEEPTA